MPFNLLFLMKIGILSRLTGFGFLFLAGGGLALGQHSVGELSDIGFTSLQGRLGLAMPTGEGVSVSQIEGSDGGLYRPDTALFPGQNFLFPSGGSTGASWHASAVGQFLYGPSSLAPDIGKTGEVITSYEANHWLQSGGLRFGTPSLLPNVEGNDVQNHSWIGSLGSVDEDVEALRRMDYMIQRDDFVAVFGLNNGSFNPVPSLMAGAYNGITVGLSSGNHSTGTSPVEGARTRPDIVVPTNATSWATATVSSAAALMIETARATPALANGDKSEVVKAVLMAGASRNEPEFAGGWNNTVIQPLDPVYGAGELDVDRSERILSSGEHDSSTTVTLPSTGWDFATASSGVTGTYFFEITESSEVGAALVWNRIIVATDTQPGIGTDYEFDATLADLNLRLFTATGFTLGTEVDASLSTIDNVELISISELAPGRYAWQVTSDTAGTDYSLAWIAIPEPALSALLTLSIFPLFRRRR